MRFIILLIFLSATPALADLRGTLKQSTATSVTITMIDSTSHYAGKTGLAAGLTIYASKAGRAPALITPTVSEISAGNMPGVYLLVLSAADTNTTGQLQLYITGSGADMNDPFWQVSANILDDAATAQDVALNQ